MFFQAKTKNARKGNWKDMPTGYPNGIYSFHHSPGATTFSIKGNEGSRMVNCRVCGFPCDIERDPRAKTDSWAGKGISYGTQLSAGTSIGDRRTTAGVKSVDLYYERTISGGCPCCATLDYDRKNV